MSRADENNDFDALFSTDDSTAGGDDLFSSLGDSTDDASGLPFDFDKAELGESELASGLESGLGFDLNKSDDEIPGLTDANVDAAAVAAPDLEKKSKKGKKERGAKAKKEKKTKAAKTEKTEKGPRVRHGSPIPFFVLTALFLLIVVAGNFAAFATAGAGAIGFLIYFNLLGLVLLSVPALLLWQQTKQRVGLFDVALALVVACLALGSMAILAFQAKTYGGSSKVASVVAQTVDRA